MLKPVPPRGTLNYAWRSIYNVDGGLLLARIRALLGQRRRRRRWRPGGPRLHQAAHIALFYWENYRLVDWDDGELKLREPRLKAAERKTG